MNKKTIFIIISLLFLSPLIAELLSGSAPPLEFFNPVALLILVLLYGCGTLLIREAKVRWKLQWSIIFLAVAYGIVEEGLMTKAFFNTQWVDVGVLSGYGMYFGVQWPWTITLMLFHATLSTLIPIAIIELLWPEYKNVPLLKKRGLILTFIGITSVTIFGMVMMGTKIGDKMIPYHPNPLLLIGSFIVVMLLIWLAYKFKESKVITNKLPIFSSFVFAVFGFLYLLVFTAVTSLLVKANMSGLATIFIQIIEIFFILLFVFYQICNRNVTKHHIIALIFGTLLFLVLITPILEIAGARGMVVVGIIGLISLIFWRHKVLKVNKLA